MPEWEICQKTASYMKKFFPGIIFTLIGDQRNIDFKVVISGKYKNLNKITKI